MATFTFTLLVCWSFLELSLVCWFPRPIRATWCKQSVAYITPKATNFYRQQQQQQQQQQHTHTTWIITEFTHNEPHTHTHLTLELSGSNKQWVSQTVNRSGVILSLSPALFFSLTYVAQWWPIGRVIISLSLTVHKLSLSLFL